MCCLYSGKEHTQIIRNHLAFLAISFFNTILILRSNINISIPNTMHPCVFVCVLAAAVVQTDFSMPSQQFSSLSLSWSCSAWPWFDFIFQAALVPQMSFFLPLQLFDFILKTFERGLCECVWPGSAHCGVFCDNLITTSGPKCAH